MFKIGFSKDIHNFINGNNFVLGGVTIKHNKTIDAKSDGDVLFHAIAESILGALGLEDIGTYFKDDLDDGFSSEEIIKFSLNELNKKGFKISNIDTLIMLDNPKMSDYKKVIKENTVKALLIKDDQLSIKFTTSEGNFKDYIEASSIVLIEKED